MKTVYLLRYKGGKKQTLSTHLVVNERGKVLYNGYVLELAWRDNARRVSCVPAGVYPLKLEHSPKFGRKLWEAYEIPKRSETKFHNGLTHKSSEGCYITGEYPFDITGDSLEDVLGSKDALQEFMDAMGDDTEARLVIINDYNR